MEENPKFERILSQTPWLSHVVKSARIQGKPVEWSFVTRHRDFNALPQQADAVAIAGFTQDNGVTKALLCSEYRVTVGGYRYGFPAGLIAPGENVTVAAARELQEETGYTIKRVLAVSPMRLYSSAGCTDETNQMVFVELGENVGTALEDIEDITMKLYTVEEIRMLLHDPLSAWDVKAWSTLYAFSMQPNIYLGE